MIFFAREKNHMSATMVIIYRLMILMDLAVGGFVFYRPLEPGELWVGILASILSVVCGVGLIMLLRGFKRGGYISLIASTAIALFFLTLGIIEEFGIQVMAEPHSEIIPAFLGLGIFHIITILIVLLGSRKEYLK